jgi:hypothetical protein
MPKFCYQCGEANRIEGANFCGDCGAPFESITDQSKRESNSRGIVTNTTEPPKLVDNIIEQNERIKHEVCKEINRHCTLIDAEGIYSFKSFLKSVNRSDLEEILMGTVIARGYEEGRLSIEVKTLTILKKTLKALEDYTNAKI